MDLLIDFNTISVIFRIFLATIFGGAIGFERGRHGRAAGLRTHILICLGSAMTSMIGLYLCNSFGSNGDVSRISAQVISGIGFLGAGTILIKNNSVVTGLTTAAGMWATAAIGVAVGYGFYEGAIICTLICIITATFLTKFEIKQKTLSHVYIEISDASKVNSVINSIKSGMKDVCGFDILPSKSKISWHLGIMVAISKEDVQDIIDTLCEIDDVLFAIGE